MAKGTINGSPSNSHYTLTCEWTSTANTNANTSTITAIVYLAGNGYTTSSSYWSCVINGTTVTSNKSADIGGKTELGRRTWTVNHNNDGSCSVNISFSYKNGLSSSGKYTTNSGSGSGTVTLDKIPRVSDFSLNTTSGTLPCNFTVTINKASSSFTHTVIYQFGNGSYTKANKTNGTSVTVDCGIGDCNNMPNSTSGTGTITVITYNGSTEIGRKSKTITLYVPNNIVPSVGISITPNNTVSGHDVEGKTTFTVTATNASGSYNSTIKSYSITGGGLNSSSSSATSGTLSAGNYTFTVKVTDSRGRTATASASRLVHSYSNPVISSRCYRCDDSGNASNSGIRVAVEFSWQITDIASANLNGKQYYIQQKTTGGGWNTSVNWTNLGSYSGSTKIVLPETYNQSSSYDIQVIIKDNFTQVGSSIMNIATMFVLFDIERSGVGIGKIHEQGVLDVGGSIYMSGTHRVCHRGGSDGSQLDIGNTDRKTIICSLDNPSWWDGSRGYTIWTDKDCGYSSGNNCETWRFPNGMQVSVMKVHGTWNITTQWGSVYSSPIINAQNFNIAFLETPKVIINAYNENNTSMMVVQTSSPTTTATGAIYLWKPTSQSGIKSFIEYIAIGRWK